MWAIVWLTALTADALIFGKAKPDEPGVFGWIAIACLLVPHVGVMVRRYHDIGKTGWWGLLMLVPYVGWLWVAIDLATAGELDENRFGDPPYGMPAGQAPLAEPVIRS